MCVCVREKNSMANVAQKLMDEIMRNFVELQFDVMMLIRFWIISMNGWCCYPVFINFKHFLNGIVLNLAYNVFLIKPKRIQFLYT